MRVDTETTAYYIAPALSTEGMEVAFGYDGKSNRIIKKVTYLDTYRERYFSAKPTNEKEARSIPFRLPSKNLGYVELNRNECGIPFTKPKAPVCKPKNEYDKIHGLNRYKMHNLVKGYKVRVNIDKVGTEGDGVVNLGSKFLFVKGAADKVGTKMTVKIDRVTNTHAFATPIAA